MANRRVSSSDPGRSGSPREPTALMFGALASALDERRCGASYCPVQALMEKSSRIIAPTEKAARGWKAPDAIPTKTTPEPLS